MARQKSASKMAYEQNQKNKKSKSRITTNTPIFKNEAINSYENQKTLESNQWSDIYDANSNEMSQYIHSHWTNFYNILQKQTNDYNTLLKTLKEDVFDSLKTVIVSMIDREIAFFENVETSYLNFVNKNLGKGKGKKTYKDIDSLLTAIENKLKLASQQTMLKQMMEININLESYRKVKVSTLKNMPEGKSKEEIKKELDEVISTKIQQQKWAETLFRAIYDLYTSLEKELNQFTQGVKDDLNNNVENFKIAKDLLLQIMLYGRNQNLILGKNSTDFINNLKSKGSPEDLLEIMASMNTSELFYELTSPVFLSKDTGKFTTPQLSKKIGELFESSFPSIMADVGLDKILVPLTMQNVAGKNKKVRKVTQVGEEFRSFNITDLIFAEIKTSKEQIINIGASLKLKAKHATSGSYVVTNLWEGKLGSGTDRPEEEQALVKKTTKHKNFINWIKNNIISLNSFSVDTNSRSGESYNFIEQVNLLEQELATLLLMPRFFNGFLKELKNGEFAAFDANKMDSTQPLSYTIFVIGNDKVYLTSSLIKKVRAGLISLIEPKNDKKEARFKMKMENGSFFTNIDEWPKSTTLKESESLWKAKQGAWESLEKITYSILAGNSSVSPILSAINKKLKYRSLSSKVYYDIIFDKL